MTRRYYAPPQMRVMEMEVEEMVAQSPGINNELSDREQLIKGIDQPPGFDGKGTGNRSLWDDEW